MASAVLAVFEGQIATVLTVGSACLSVFQLPPGAVHVHPGMS